MKLAEALILRSDLQKRVDQLSYRIENNISVQEGDEPIENPEILMKELDKNLEELTDLIRKINRTNNETKFDDRFFLSDALAHRDGIWKKRLIYSNIVDAASVRMDRYSKTEIKYINTIDAAEIQKKVDLLSKEWRELDTKIQSLNWTVDLIAD